MTSTAPFTTAGDVSEVKGDLQQRTAPSTIVQTSWTEGEEGNLIAGVSTVGVDNWEAIRQDPAYNLTERSVVQLKDKWRNLVKYEHVIPEDFPASADVCCRRRRTESVLALPPSEYHRLLSNKNRLEETTKTLKKRRISSHEPASSCNDPLTSRHESVCGKFPCGMQASPYGPVVSAAVLQANEKVETATGFVREALRIQTDANAMASKAMAALTQPGGNPLTKREAVLSANSFASLAQAKSLKSRAILQEALTNLLKVQNATMAVQPLMELSDVDDTANSSCKSAQHCNRSSEDSGTSLEVPASDVCGSSGSPDEEVSQEDSRGMEHHTLGQKDNIAFSNVNKFETYGLGVWGLVLDEGRSELSDVDVLDHNHSRSSASCDGGVNYCKQDPPVLAGEL